MKELKGWRMSCDVGKATEDRAHSKTLPSLHQRHSSFSNPSVASPKSKLILQPFRRFTYVTAHSPTLPLLHLRHSSFSNTSSAFSTSPALHVRHLALCPCNNVPLSNYFNIIIRSAVLNIFSPHIFPTKILYHNLDPNLM